MKTITYDPVLAQPDTAALQARITALELDNKALRENSASIIKNLAGENSELEAQLAAQAGPIENDGMHASAFAKVWGDAGGGDAGRIALAEYAYALGVKSAQAGQEPYAYLDDGDMKLLASRGKRHYVSACNEPTPSCKNPLYRAAQAPANSIAIVQAALEASAKVCDTWPDSSPRYVAKSIRAIDPQIILDGMTK